MLALALTMAANFGYAAGKSADGPPPAAVEVMPVKLQTWQNQLYATGTLAANQGVMLRAEITGRVTQLFFKPGQVVKQGEPLVQFDADMLKAKLGSAKAQLSLSQGNLQRIKELYHKQFMSKADLDKAEADVKNNQGNLDLAMAQLKQTLVTAPFTGKIGLNQIELGDYVSPGQALANLQAYDPMRVDFSLPEAVIGQVALGQSVKVVNKAYPQQTFTGTLTAIDAALDAHTRSLAMRARVPNPDSKLVPGMFAEVTVLVGKPQSVLVVPQTALVVDQGQYVYKVLENHTVKKLKVTPGERLGAEIVIVDGLKPGDMIVTAGQLKLHDNAPIIPLPAKAG